MKVLFIGCTSYIRYCLESKASKLNVEVMHFMHLNLSTSEKNQAIVYKPDVVICFQYSDTLNSLLAHLSSKKVLWTNIDLPCLVDGRPFYNDETVNNLHWLADCVSNNFDYVIHTDISKKSFLQSIGINLSGYRPYPINMDFDVESVENEIKWDVLFLGKDTERRTNFFGDLKHYYNFLHIDSCLTRNEFLSYCKKSKIIVNVGANNVPQFPFELVYGMAQGKLAVSERIMNSTLLPNIHYVLVETKRDLDRVIKELLSNQGDERIRLAGKKAVVDNYNDNFVITTLLDDLTSGVFPKVQLLTKQLTDAMLKVKVCLQFDGFDHLLMYE